VTALRRVAIVGATGLVGLELLAILEERAPEIEELRLYASDRSGGRDLRFRGRAVPVEPVDGADFGGLDVVFFMAGADVSRKYAPAARTSGALVVDNSSAFRRDPGVPLVVPEVNPGDALRHEGLIANPNCTVIQLVTAVHPIHTLSPLRRLVVSTYQSVSGAGRAAQDRLLTDTRARLEGRPARAAFNIHPGIDRLLEDGWYFEEEKVVAETKKILGDPSIAVSATVARVPVIRGHAVSVYLETERPVPLDEAWRALEAAPGVQAVPPGDLHALSPVEAAGGDPVRVGRLRRARDVERGLLLWAVADNLRKGAALNAVQIAESVLGGEGERPAPGGSDPAD
jgi:aspartate-semialdehyde dehydrogenase